MKSTLKELQWNAFQTGHNRGKNMKAYRQEESSDSDEEVSLGSDGKTPPPSDDSEESASRPPHPLPEDYQELCLHFVLSKVEEAARNFELLEMVQATFYDMLLNDAVGLGIVSGFIAADLKASLEGLRWTSFESWMYINRHGLLEAQLHQRSPLGGTREPVNGQEESSSSNDCPLPFTPSEAVEYVPDTFRLSLRTSLALCLNLLLEDYHGLCPGFNLGVATQYAMALTFRRWCRRFFTPWSLMTLQNSGFRDWHELYSVGLPTPELDYHGDLTARRMANTKSTPRVCTLDGLLAEGTIEGNFYSASGSQRLEAEVLFTSVSSSSAGTSASSFLDRTFANSSSDGPSTSSFSDGTSASPLSRGVPRALGRSVLKKKASSPIEPVLEIITDGLVFPEAPSRSDPPNGSSTHFPKREQPWRKTRAKLTPLESGDAIFEQIAAEAERRREEKKACLVNVVAKKAPSLVPCGKNPIISLPPVHRHKHQLIEDHQDDTAASTLASIKGKEVRESSPPTRSVDRLVGGEALGLQESLALARAIKAMSKRRRLDEAVAKYKHRWEKLKEDTDTWEAKKKDLQGRLNEALSKAKAALGKAEATAGIDKAAKVEELGHQRSCEEVMEFLRKRNANRPRLRARTPKKWSLSPSGEGEEDEGTTPLDGEGGTPSHVMMSTELPVSISILRTIALATFISTTYGSLCEDVKRGLYFPPNTKVGL
ncbi:LOW QUALITY PROTEIN: hypothetical protein Cgig2_025025 [Carnegiea gigantea]|uniref:Uncharacterized protein n=1 Tax=Carnegiea gigantea TaxID=171969 RepID=A0A9Q1K0N1_9CARY|nr:LOW QUALITY PROTEIN: hypothetical protein Cgig2_025025 [Carnegiea gigantea]